MNHEDTTTSLGSINDYPDDVNTCEGCEKGIKMCKRACWPTPEEVVNLIATGYGNRLMLDMWARDPDKGGHIFIIAPATPGYESRYAPDVEILSKTEEELGQMDPEIVMEFMFRTMMSGVTGGGAIYGGCNFQSPEGLCELHPLGLKPFEGKKACCKVKLKGLHGSVANSWNSDLGRTVVEEWKRDFLKQS